MLGGLGLSHAARADVFNDRPSNPHGEPCTDWCGVEQGWRTLETGTGPETAPTTLIDVGAVSEQLAAAGKARTETAALFRFDFRFDGNFNQHHDESRGYRLRLGGQKLGWRVGDAMGPTADTGGMVALGFTQGLAWLSRRSRLSATLDAEGATGLAVRGGLGMRTTDVGARAVGAAGLALGMESRVGSLRAHARVLQALTSDPAWSTAIEVGAGIATRFDWPRFHGPLPLEVWADLRERRAVDRDTREREVAAGLSWVRTEDFSRVGITAIATEEHFADGTRGTGRAVLVQLDRPFGSF